MFSLKEKMNAATAFKQGFTGGLIFGVIVALLGWYMDHRREEITEEGALWYKRVHCKNGAETLAGLMLAVPSRFVGRQFFPDQASDSDAVVSQLLAVFLQISLMIMLYKVRQACISREYHVEDFFGSPVEFRPEILHRRIEHLRSVRKEAVQESNLRIQRAIRGDYRPASEPWVEKNDQLESPDNLSLRAEEIEDRVDVESELGIQLPLALNSRISSEDTISWFNFKRILSSAKIVVDVKDDEEEPDVVIERMSV